jgi:serine/threonine protein kinase
VSITVDYSNSSSGQDTQTIGSPFWMAPEVIQLESPTTASDIWLVFKKKNSRFVQTKKKKI